MKPFDEKLSDRIRERFDNYDEPFDPQGWERMEARFGNKARPRKVVFWTRMARAAAVLLLLASAFYVQRFVVQNIDTGEAIHRVASPIPSRPGMLPVAYDPSPVLLQRALPGIHHIFPDSAEEPIPDGLGWGDPHSMWAPANGVDDPHTMWAPANGMDDPHTMWMPASRMPPVSPAWIAADRTHQSRVLAGMPPPVRGRPLPEARVDPRPAPAEDPDALLTAEMPARVRGRGRDRSVQWDLLAGTQLTYAVNQVAEGVGFGAGVMAEYPVLSTVALSSGLVLSHNRFSVEEMPVDKHTEQADYGAFSFMQFEVFGDHTYRHYVADVPLNVSVGLWERPQRTLSVVAGVSSLLYFGQTVEGENTVYATGFVDVDGAFVAHESGEVGRHTISSGEPRIGSRIDPFRVINFSVAYETSLGGNALRVEPFVKIPVQPVSGHQLRFGNGGINIRYRLFD